MGCPAQVLLGNNVIFSVTTHDPSTGILTDADFPPLYRIYEELNPVAIATGVMAKLDDVNTTGFYAASFACTTPTFTEGLVYTIYIEATVNADLGGISYAFNIWTKLLYTTTAADQNSSADMLLKRDLVTGSSISDRTVQNALRILRNRREILLGVLSVYDETDAVVAWTANTTTTPGNPVNKIDPV